MALLARHLDPADWVLVGGQMVALHLHASGIEPARTTTDIDVVANVIANRHALDLCRRAAAELQLEPVPSANGRYLHRFASDALVLDLMVPDHLPKHLGLRLVGRQPVAIPGGQRALDRAVLAHIETDEGQDVIPVPDTIGALVMKARAWSSDARDRGRHLLDLAQLCATVPDPLELRATLEAKELRSLRKVVMPIDPTTDPWLRISQVHRSNALEAWMTVTSA